TREKPAARPWLGVVTASSALALTLGAAWLLANRRVAPLALEPPIELPSWPISFAIPKGWSASDIGESPDDDSVRWRDQQSYAGRDSGGRRIRAEILYRTLPHGTTARQAGLGMLAARLRDDSISISDMDTRPSPQAVGPLFGEKLRFVGEDQRGR